MKRSPKKYCQINQIGFNTVSFDFVRFHWYWGTMDLVSSIIKCCNMTNVYCTSQPKSINV